MSKPNAQGEPVAGVQQSTERLREFLARGFNAQQAVDRMIGDHSQPQASDAGSHTGLPEHEWTEEPITEASITTVNPRDAEGNLTPQASRCGHGYLIPKCPMEQCAARELYQVLHDAVANLVWDGPTADSGNTAKEKARAALAKARGEW